MSEKDHLKEIANLLKQISDSSNEIADIIKPKPKEPEEMSLVLKIFCLILVAMFFYILFGPTKFLGF